MQRILVVVFLLFSFALVNAQNLEVIHMAEIEAWDNADNDTLYILNFWATWCKPCVAEMPYFERVQEEMLTQKVKVIFISMDFSNQYESRLIPFLKKKKLKSKVVALDEPKYHLWIDKVSTEWSGAIPATLFVQHSKDIRDFHEGEFTYEELRDKVETLLTVEK